MANELKKFYSHLSKEAFVKALVFGLLIGFAVLFVSATVFWFLAFEQLWVALLLFFATVAIAVPAFFYVTFRPTKKEVARRVDELGLEERFVTMEQYKDDTSYMAKRQREDAMAQLKRVSTVLMKFAVPTAVVISLIVLATAGVSMTTVSGLSNAGIIMSGRDVLNALTAPAAKEYQITYVVEGKGELALGDEKGKTMAQTVVSGASAEPIEAVAAAGWAFDEWQWVSSDGKILKSYDPYRQDVNVTYDITVIAVFVEAGAVAPSDDLNEDLGKPGEDGDESNSSMGSKPTKPKEEESDKAGQGEGEGTGSGQDSAERNQIEDGKTSYKDIWGEASDQANQNASNNEGLSDGDKSAVGGFFDSLNP